MVRSRKLEKVVAEIGKGAGHGFWKGDRYSTALLSGVALSVAVLGERHHKRTALRVFPIIIFLFLLRIGLQIEFALRRYRLHWGRRRLHAFLIFRYVQVFTRPIRPLAQMRRNVAPRKITAPSFHAGLTHFKHMIQ